MLFSELNLKPEILEALGHMGYKELTPIQEKTFGPILSGRDLLARAETGSGKTGACGVPLVQMIDPSLNAIQALILVPTRELALQYVEEIHQISRLAEVVPFAVFGGFSMEIQKAKLRDGVHILVATPGRLIDFLYNTTSIDLSSVRTLVLDEADEMLKMGFIEDVDFIMSCLIHEHQTLFFAATMPEEIDRLIGTYLKDPVRVELNKEQVAPQSLVHHFQYTESRDRLNTLMEYLHKKEDLPGDHLLQFPPSRRETPVGVEGKSGFPGIHPWGPGAIEANIDFRAFPPQGDYLHDCHGRCRPGTRLQPCQSCDQLRLPCRDWNPTPTGQGGQAGWASGIAMTFVTDKELVALKALLQANHIDPVWHGDIP